MTGQSDNSTAGWPGEGSAVHPEARRSLWTGENAGLRRRLFGTREAADLWGADSNRPLQLFSLRTREALPLDMLDILAVRIDDSQQRVQVELALHGVDPPGCWLQFHDAADRQHGVALPGDHRARFYIGLILQRAEDGPMAIGQTEASVSAASAEPLDLAVAAWQAAQEGDYERSRELLKQTVGHQQFGESLLAGILIGLSALKLQKPELPGRSLFDLMRKFSPNADLRYLLSEQILAIDHTCVHRSARTIRPYDASASASALPDTGETAERLRAALNELQQCPTIPRTTFGLSRLDMLVSRLLSMQSRFAPDVCEYLTSLKSGIEQAVVYLNPDSQLLALGHYAPGDQTWHALAEQRAQPSERNRIRHVQAFTLMLLQRRPVSSLPALMESLPMSLPTVSKHWQYLESLADAMRSGQQHNEFPAYFKQLATVLRGWYIRHGLRPDDAEELAIETAEKIALSLDQFTNRGDGSFRAWCCAIAQNEQANWGRRLARFGARPVSSELLDQLCATPDFEDDDGGIDDAVQRAFLRLTHRDRELLELSIVQGLSFADIASRLKLSEAGARKAAQRARERFREEFDAESVLDGHADKSRPAN